MGDVIAWKTAEEILKILAKENALVAGMSIEEAAAAYGYTLTSSGMYVKTVADVASVAGSAATAGEAIAGSVATGGATTTAANLTLYTTAEGTTAVGGLGSVALPIAACVLAGAAGYTVGTIASDYITEKYPEFFIGMFESISEFTTGDKYGLAYIFTGDGEVYMPEASQQAIKEYLESQMNQTGNGSDYIESGDSQVNFKLASVGEQYQIKSYRAGVSYNSQFITAIECTSPVYSFAYYRPETTSSVQIVWISKEGFTLHRKGYKVTVDGNLTADNTGEGIIENTEYPTIVDGYTIYGLTTGLGEINILTLLNLDTIAPINTWEGLTDSNDFANFMSDVQIKILYGEHKTTSKVPSGLTKNEVPSTSKITTPTTSPEWSPVKLPSTSPYQFPTEFPSLNPDAEVDPSIITPYLPQPQPYPENVPVVQPSPNPNPNPITIPVPSYELTPQPTPSPDADPSAEPVPNPQPEPTPPTKPEDTGNTPKPSVPVIPPISSSATGLLHVYNPTNEQINEFGAWLWTTFSGDIIDTVAKLFNNPMDAVIGLHELYCSPSTGDSTTIKAGFLDSGVTSRLVSSRYVNVDCGAITVPEYWGNYLDYSPYTKVYCYLPFIGIVELNADDIIGHGVQIDYKVDTYNGSCIAMIITAKNVDQESVTYQFSGNCSVEVPITSGMKSSIQSALIGAATCAVGASTGGLGAMATAGAIGATRRGLNSKNTVSHSGTFGSSFGAMGIKKPYIIVKRPVQKVVAGYNKNYGYPAHKMVTIGNCSGYLRCRDFEVVSSTATEEEKRRIEVLLKEGVYV